MNKKLFSGIISAAMLTVGASSAFAMPADIQEGVTSSDYNSYDHVNSYQYNDSDLISIDADYKATANAMIREAPFGTIKGSVQKGQTYHVVGECSDCMWYKISGDISGYVYAGYLTPVDKDTSAQTGSNSVRDLDMMMTVRGASSVNVRTAPSKSGQIKGVVKEGTEMHITGNVLNTEWYRCEYNGETAYICDDYVKPDFPQTMACTARALNVRAEANGSSKIIGVLNHGDKIKVSEDDNDWLKFSLPDGTIGYVYDEYVAAVS